MSFIRPGSEGRWVDHPDVEQLYVYSSGDAIEYLPRDEELFVEVVMRMLEQSDELSHEELKAVFQAFRTRLRWGDEYDG